MQREIIVNSQDGIYEYEAGRMLYEQRQVKALEATASNMQFVVNDNGKKEILFSMDEVTRCTCSAYYKWGKCRHIIAATLMADQIGILKEFKKKKAYKNGEELAHIMEEALPAGEHLQLEVTLFLQREKGKTLCKAGLRIGQERYYVIRDIAEFLQAKKKKELIEFGKGFMYQPLWMVFSRNDESILEVFEYLCQGGLGEGEGRKNTRVISLPESYVPLLLSRLEESRFRIAIGETMYHINGIEHRELPFYFHITRQPQGINIHASWHEALIPLTEKGLYVWSHEKVIKVNKNQQKMIPILIKNSINHQTEFFFPFSQTSKVVSEIIPWLSLSGAVEVDSFLQEKVIKTPLETKIYLDKEGKRIVAKVEFTYGEKVLNPFAPQVEEEETHQKLVVREIKKEQEILEQLERAGFHVGKENIYLQGDEGIFFFLSQGVSDLQDLCQIYASKQFKKMTPRKPNFRVEAGLNRNRLDLTFFEEETPSKEILEILRALEQKKDYFRLKDGTFLDLSQMEQWQEIAEEVVESALPGQTEQSNMISLNSYKTLYLNTLLEQSNTLVKIENQTEIKLNQLQELKEQLPEGLSANLREYQKRGLSWLQALWNLKMGGILADEMGLGKTLQVIALLQWIKENEKPQEPNIVITPTSLCYNWQAEINKYAPNLRVAMLHGSQSARAAQIEKIQRNQYDIIITSYPILRRDIDYLEKMNFSVVVIDEAQHIKNPSSIGTLAVKRLQGSLRLALTGTPMENHIGELWSVMDFVLPGYLLTYGSFMRKYTEEKELPKLKEKITPFLLRRLKKDVLQDLPEKMEMTMVAQMSIEQQRAYQASMMRLKGRINSILEEDHFSQGKMEVLAAITELRQMCCHPALLLPDYSGSSGKLDLLMDILPPMIENGHRILLFSQFTTMLKIIQRNLEAQGIDCVYLDGNTKAEKRLELAQEFNQGKGTVFLISLKAGGTGLNLIGADVVIHYDPWWNPAVEDQATDRAHRIGQKKNVEVIKLITHDSIEEQVVKLGEKKKEVFEKLITSAEQLPTSLTKEDIRALFA